MRTMITPGTHLPSRRVRQRGFTLIEMLVVLVIMAILLAVAGIPASADGGAIMD